MARGVRKDAMPLSEKKEKTNKQKPTGPYRRGSSQDAKLKLFVILNDC